MVLTFMLCCSPTAVVEILYFKQTIWNYQDSELLITRSTVSQLGGKNYSAVISSCLYHVLLIHFANLIKPTRTFLIKPIILTFCYNFSSEAENTSGNLRGLVGGISSPPPTISSFPFWKAPIESLLSLLLVITADHPTNEITSQLQVGEISGDLRVYLWEGKFWGGKQPQQ